MNSLNYVCKNEKKYIFQVNKWCSYSIVVSAVTVLTINIFSMQIGIQFTNQYYYNRKEELTCCYKLCLGSFFLLCSFGMGIGSSLRCTCK